MRRFYLLFVLLLLSFGVLRAQNESSCTQVLRLAQGVYEQGRLHELPALLKGCSTNGTDEEKRQAFLLLTMAHIYLEEPEEADQSMLGLLRSDHFFEPDPTVHPAEFISLYNKFRTKSLFRVGVNLGPMLNLVQLSSDDYVAEPSQGTGKYAPRVGFQIGLAFEKDLLPRRPDKHMLLTLAPELVFAIRGYGYSSSFFNNEQDGSLAADLSYLAKVSRFELNPLVKYNFRKSAWNPFLVAGPGINFLTKNTISGAQLDRLDGSGTVTGADIPEYKDASNQLSFSAIVGVGVRYRLGGAYATLDVRYRQDLTNMVSSNIPSAQFDYGIASDAFKLSALSVNLGIQYAYFNPKKLIK